MRKPEKGVPGICLLALGTVLFCLEAWAMTDQEQWADFSLSANPVEPGAAVLFDAERSEFPGEPISYEWDFGDGEVGFGVQVTHAYADTGDYITVLEVFDDAGNSDTREIRVMVLDSLTFIRYDQYVVVRDGEKISVALDLPPFSPPAGGFPVIVSGHGGCNGTNFMNPEFWRGTGVLTGIDAIEKGYAILRFLARGCYDSGGDVMFGGRKEALDVREIISLMLEKAPINEERIGYQGGSHGGLLGLNLLVGDDRMRAVMPLNGTTNAFRGIAGDETAKYESMNRQAGTLLENTGERLNWKWAISLLSGVDREQTEQGIHKWIDTDWLLERIGGDPDPPAVYLKFNWTDMHFRGNEFLAAFRELQDMGVPVQMYAGYGGHNNWTTGGFGGDAQLQQESRRRFFDYYLMDEGSPVPEDSTVVYLVYGTRNFDEESFEYGVSSTWPPPETQYAAFYFKEDGMLSLEPPGGTEIPDTVSNSTPGEIPETVLLAPWVLDNFDQFSDSAIIQYTGKLLENVGEFTDSTGLCRICFESPSLEDTLEMAGIPEATYFVSSTGNEFQLVTEVWDVFPDDNAVLVTIGPAGSRAHTAGRDFVMSFDLYGIAYRFLPGHGIRVCLSNKSSDDVLDWGKGLGRKEGPGQDLTWGEGPYIQAFFTDSETMILHDDDHASSLVIPVVGDLPVSP